VTDLVIREVGKPRSEAAGEVARGVAILRYFGQAALLPDGQTLPAASPGTLLMARHRPVGVTGLVTPWNFPVAIPLWKAAPSLAFGNAAVLKPAEEAPAVALLLAEILTPHLPPGVFQVVLGAAEAGQALAGHPGVAAVSFTGSVPAGREVVARVAGRGARVQAEMGGLNASVVLADADFDRAAAAIAYAAMGYAGQKCTATSRIVVEDAAYAKFRDHLGARCGSPMRSTPAWSGSTPRRRGWTSTPPSAARNSSATGPGSRGSRPGTSTPRPRTVTIVP
jgi:aldehyde dehydrogenase (NAD+)